MGIESLTIELDNSDGIYFPGQEVSGIVHISNLSTKILKGSYFDLFSFMSICSAVFFCYTQEFTSSAKVMQNFVSMN